MSLIIRLVINAFAFWVVSLIPALQITITPFPPGEPLQLALTLLAVGAIFGVVNTIVGTVIKIVAFPIYLLTLGLVAFLVNGFLLWLTAELTKPFDWGLVIGNFWWGIVATILIALINGVFNIILRPQKKRR